MGPAVAVEWAAPADGQPSPAGRHALAEWAEARGFRLVEAPRRALPVVPQDPTLADAVEQELERARDATTALDASAVEKALTKADALLLAHPELPQAAWLEAEVLRAWGTRWQRLPPRDLARSGAVWARAASLDGGRVTGVGEVFAAKPPTVTVSLALPAPLGVDARTTVRLDGTAVEGASVVAAPGDHQLTVTYDGALVWASWVTIQTGRAVQVTLPEAAACTRQDLSRAHVADGVVVATGVACGAWVYAEETAASPGELLLASCEGAACGPPFRWKLGTFGPILPPSRSHDGHWPAWATWVIVGASAAAITGATLAASGVFRPTHDEPVLTTGGLHTSSAPLQLHLGD